MLHITVSNTSWGLSRQLSSPVCIQQWTVDSWTDTTICWQNSSDMTRASSPAPASKLDSVSRINFLWEIVKDWLWTCIILCPVSQITWCHCHFCNFYPHHLQHYHYQQFLSHYLTTWLNNSKIIIFYPETVFSNISLPRLDK